jgi:membrane fusion protein (multidrug efflux system)
VFFRNSRPQGPRTLGILLLLIPMAGCGDEAVPTSSEAPPPAVVVVAATAQDVAASVEFVGRTEAYREVDLRARVQGFLDERAFEEGETVEEGDLLFVIDPAEYRADLQAAEAEVERAEATYQTAVNELERARTLVERGNISQSEVDKRAADAGRAEADIKAAKAALERAQLDLGYTEIRAPFGGRIGRGTYDVGNLVGPESGVLASVVALDPIHVTFPVSEREYLSYEKQENKPEILPRIILADGSTFEHDGTIDFIDNRVDPMTGTLQVRATFPNPTGLLLPGQYVGVVLTADTPDRKTVVPQAAVQENQAGFFVLVVDADNRVETRTIQTGQRVGTGWVVEQGLEPGEIVIVEGLQKVRPGGEVTPTRATSEPADGAAGATVGAQG